MSQDNINELSTFIPNTEFIDLEKFKEKVIDSKEFTVEQNTGDAFALNPVSISSRKSVPKEPLRFEDGVNLVFRDIISLGTVSRGGMPLFAEFFSIRESLIKALCKYTNYKSVVIRWERPGSKEKFILMENVNAYEVRAYISQGRL